MLKLVKAKDVRFDGVKEYYDSFENKNELNSMVLGYVKDGEEAYVKMRNSWGKLMYYLIDEDNPDYIIGIGDIEDSGVYNFHEDYLNFGHISYGVRPNERNKGYGKAILKLLLEKCEERGMGEVCVSCKKDNIASKKVILGNKGKFEKEFFSDESGQCLKFWIKLRPGIYNRMRRIVNIANKKL